MNKARKSLGAIAQQSALITIAITSLMTTCCLAWNGLAPLRGGPDNGVTKIIGHVVVFVGDWLSHGNKQVADLWFLQAPIALVTYLLLCVLPVAVGGIVIEWWLLWQGKSSSGSVETAP
ncbi:hypothetical protein WM11_11745 [Burkholderia ubonensis]|uniref:hypothetical protein n=1 Tax=Burkholderia ubonensis TaxID=101571 RepID=UPI00075DC13D|nr:hypothetical protein [Burkholderia ubonensis]KWK06059.1 hypothetical protein WM11_11745 [Burkholderia ubonensis]KWK56553.1 hypothetical protein WM14_27240 [Burkholderia ubonensis]